VKLIGPDGESLRFRYWQMMKLTDHFTLEELTLSQTAERHGISNAPDDEALANLRELALLLEDIRHMVKVPVIVSSGYRSPEVNSLVGGAPNSAHLYGRAADIIAPPFTPYDLAERIAVSSLQFDKLILEFGRWIHIQIADNPRRLVLSAVHVDGQTEYVTGLV